MTPGLAGHCAPPPFLKPKGRGNRVGGPNGSYTTNAFLRVASKFVRDLPLALAPLATPRRSTTCDPPPLGFQIS